MAGPEGPELLSQKDYARRKGWSRAEAERWLGPNLGYDPDDEVEADRTTAKAS